MYTHTQTTRILTKSRQSNLPAGNSCISVVPVVVTDGAPDLVHTHLNAASSKSGGCPTQSKITIVTDL